MASAGGGSVSSTSSVPDELASSAGAGATSDAAAPDGPQSLRRSGAAGVAWQGTAYVSGKVVVAVTTLVLARIVAPDQFGLVALATVFITFADVVSDGG